MFLRNKSINKVFNFNPLLPLKYDSFIHNIAFSSKKTNKKKIVSSESGEKYVQIKHRLKAKTVLKTLMIYLFLPKTQVFTS